MAKGIDLGELQKEYETLKRTHQTDLKNLEKAQVQVDNSKKTLQDAYQNLKDASRAVLE
jgi:hypothetical protein